MNEKRSLHVPICSFEPRWPPCRLILDLQNAALMLFCLLPTHLFIYHTALMSHDITHSSPYDLKAQLTQSTHSSHPSSPSSTSPPTSHNRTPSCPASYSPRYAPRTSTSQTHPDSRSAPCFQPCRLGNPRRRPSTGRAWRRAS